MDMRRTVDLSVHELQEPTGRAIYRDLGVMLVTTSQSAFRQRRWEDHDSRGKVLASSNKTSIDRLCP